MGLHFSHGDARFGYIQFNRILRMIEGYILHLEDIDQIMKKKWGGHKETDADIAERIESLNILIEHGRSDYSEAQISVSQMKKLHPILNRIICELEMDKVSLAGFAGSIKDAIDSKEPLKFV